MFENPTPKERAADQLCALLIGLTYDLSFETQCDAMQHLLRAIPHAGMTPSFLRWTTNHRKRLLTGVQSKIKVKDQQLLLNLTNPTE